MRTVLLKDWSYCGTGSGIGRAKSKYGINKDEWEEIISIVVLIQ